MKIMLLGALVGAGLVMAAVAAPPDRTDAQIGLASQTRGSASGEGMIAFSEIVGQKYQQITVIDPKLRAMSVYHIDLQSGVITLKNVRNFHWDLQMLEFNAVEPLPSNLRALLESR